MDIRKIELKQQSLKEETTEELAVNVKEKLKEEFNFNKLATQLKGTLIELGDLRNRCVRCTLIFQNIVQKPNKTWEGISKILAELLTSLTYHKHIMK